MLSILDSLQYSETLADGECVARGAWRRAISLKHLSASWHCRYINEGFISLVSDRACPTLTRTRTHLRTHSCADPEPVSSSHKEINQPAQSELTSLQSTVFQFSLLSSRSLASALDSWWCRLFCIFFTDFWEFCRVTDLSKMAHFGGGNHIAWKIFFFQVTLV